MSTGVVELEDGRSLLPICLNLKKYVDCKAIPLDRLNPDLITAYQWRGLLTSPVAALNAFDTTIKSAIPGVRADTECNHHLEVNEVPLVVTSTLIYLEDTPRQLFDVNTWRTACPPHTTMLA